MIECLVGLGSNQGDRAAALAAALARLRATPGVTVEAASRYLSTAPVGGPPGQPPFLNAAARLRTTLAPRAMLSALLEIEQELGRQRRERWGPRTVDLDLLLYGDAVIDEPGLITPHPRFGWRRFVLDAAVEVAGLIRHPAWGLTIAELWRRLSTTPPLALFAPPEDASSMAAAASIARQSAQGARATLIAQASELPQVARWAPPGSPACYLALVEPHELQRHRPELWPPRLWVELDAERRAAPGIPLCRLPAADPEAAAVELAAALQAMR